MEVNKYERNFKIEIVHTIQQIADCLARITEYQSLIERRVLDIEGLTISKRLISDTLAIQVLQDAISNIEAEIKEYAERIPNIHVTRNNLEVSLAALRQVCPHEETPHKETHRRKNFFKCKLCGALV